MSESIPLACQTRVVTTPEAPPAIGPYSQAIVAGDLVFTSGQIPLDPLSGQMVAGGLEAQARRVLDNLCAVLRAAGSDLSLAVKATVYLTDLGNYGEVNQIWGEYFSEKAPARSAVQVAALPRGALIEVDLVARVATPTA